MKIISRTVWILSLVSLFTDTASEMLYPVMPVYLQSIGFSIVLIGILEGIAEAVAGLSKGYFGKLSDVSGRRAPFVQAGYALSALSKPMMAVFIYPVWIFFARTLDRLGKGLRTGARDAILSGEATPENKARIFGFHRSLDTVGAVLGPSCALVYLYYYPGRYNTLFVLALIPGLLAVSTSFFLKEKKHTSHRSARTGFFSFLRYWKSSPAGYRKLIIGLLVFTLFNSSDVFLLLKIKQSGMNDTQVIGIYIFYNLVYALSSFPLGILADKTSLKKIFIAGLTLFSLVYFGMSVTSDPVVFGCLFFLYGVYAAATEGISKAWISTISDKKDVATAIGTYSAFQSVCTMIASSLAGLIWFNFGSTATFVVTGTATLGVLLYFTFFINPLKKQTTG